MFDRIEVNVIKMAGKLVLVTQRMLPRPPLPDAAFAFGAAAGGECFIARQTKRESGFDQAPAHGEIRVVLGRGQIACR